MEADTFDERAFFAAIQQSGARALLIGRRAMVALGLPVLTADYDFWVHFDDVEAFNAALNALDMVATLSPAEARARGRYTVENGEHVDVMIPREVHAIDGGIVRFDDIWERRVVVDVRGVDVALPAIDDLIATKRFASRPRDITDIRTLEIFRDGGR